MEIEVPQPRLGMGTGAAALRLQRYALGLPVADTARLLGVGAEYLAAVEAGENSPGGALSVRISAFAELSADSAFATTDFLTLAALAALLGDSGADGPDALRLVIQASDDFAALAAAADRTFFLAEPCATRDPRVDALLAALAVHLCRGAGMPATPEWTRQPERYLDTFWRFPAASGTLEAFKYQRTPSCFRARGIIFNADNLVSV